ncbi:C4-dicarboxylate transporter DcuC [Campylobacter corcagiensis]|uniref:C4-dicarboxylate transporter DcuC n=1 Tax=Campylobacter corcagiensis TaxID=1448857 RepID=A0A7M1LEW5_9BACT|nr:C4-dicarboxylate transporter DcuC [Campylobacter corcagiensis]QKF64727.1 C4-dicarboxylate transporter, DcuC family [Campylobacter corcagiensis]QOQ87109.1 C4-dicarboxylate transporter DcuC [Campylobacter corcagiensis]
MQNFYIYLALAGILVAVVLLVMKKDTKTVLLGVGLVLCLLALKPLSGLDEFASAMTKGALIMAICSSMGFAYVMKLTGCDQQLVNALTKPLGNLGIFLIPIAAFVTSLVNIAIPSAAGCAAAVGATLIPLMIAAGIKPAMAAAAILAGTFGSVLSPGHSHNAFVADMTGKSIADMISVQFMNAISSVVIMLICLTIVAVIFKDYQKTSASSQSIDTKVNYLHAIMPIVPLVILLGGNIIGEILNGAVANGVLLSEGKIYTTTENTPALIAFLVKFSWLNMGVAQAMLLGVIISLIVTLSNPEKISKEFFKGMGNAYGDIMGIIIAATVFVAGLKACGAIDYIIDILKHSGDYVKFGGTFIPFIMGIITGSGDAATLAFNEAITTQAAKLGFDQATLGMAASIAGSLGRTMSPIAGVTILCAGLAGANPVDIIKRTALGSIVSVCFIAFFLL